MKRSRFTEDGMDASRARRGIMGASSPTRREPCQSDLPGFFGRLISGKMALRREGRADEKESIQRRANGRDPARS